MLIETLEFQFLPSIRWSSPLDFSFSIMLIMFLLIFSLLRLIFVRLYHFNFWVVNYVCSLVLIYIRHLRLVFWFACLFILYFGVYFVVFSLNEGEKSRIVLIMNNRVHAPLYKREFVES